MIVVVAGIVAIVAIIIAIMVLSDNRESSSSTELDRPPAKPLSTDLHVFANWNAASRATSCEIRQNDVSSTWSGGLEAYIRYDKPLVYVDDLVCWYTINGHSRPGSQSSCSSDATCEVDTSIIGGSHNTESETRNIFAGTPLPDVRENQIVGACCSIRYYIAGSPGTTGYTDKTCVETTVTAIC